MKLRLVVDTNKIIASLLRDGVVRRVALHPVVELVTPAGAFEVEKHTDEILRKVSGELFRLVMSELRRKITPIKVEELAPFGGG